MTWIEIPGYQAAMATRGSWHAQRRENLSPGRTLVLILSLLTTVSGCAGVGANETAKSLADKGCKLDAMRICGAIRNRPVDMASTGLQADQRMVEQNSPITSDMVVPIAMPNGEPALTIHCGINTQFQSVTYAGVARGPAVSDAGVKYLRAHGYCSDF
ncbi:MAG TPA: hypothetical protein VK302_03885 [Terriglobales bacterium]|nr:hypothetical protein [Terriglobales bacterium]